MTRFQIAKSRSYVSQLSQHVYSSVDRVISLPIAPACVRPFVELVAELTAVFAQTFGRLIDMATVHEGGADDVPGDDDSVWNANEGLWVIRALKPVAEIRPDTL
jgi:hypothetical protein